MYPGVNSIGAINAAENGCKDRKIQDWFRFSIQKRFRLQLCIIEFGDIPFSENLLMRFRHATKAPPKAMQS